MKVLAAYMIHYGKEYLSQSMESIKDHVDKIVVFYSSVPTYGHQGNIKNPDTKEEIEAICNKHGAELMDITSNNFSRENSHRQMANTYAENHKYDVLLTVDYDEIWEGVELAIKEAYEGDCYRYGVSGSQWITFWKSFDEYVTDGFAPIRIFNLGKNKQTEGRISVGNIYHCGYNISDDLMRYKISCHGHKSEIHRMWFNDKWLSYRKGLTTHLHPASQDIWIETKDYEGHIPKVLK